MTQEADVEAQLRATCATLGPMEAARGFQQVVDLFMVLTVGIASLVVLFRVLFAVFPPPSDRKPPVSSPAALAAASANSTGPGAKKLVALARGANTQSAGSALAKRFRSFSVKDRLEDEIRALLPRRSTYYNLPFFADTVANKAEFMESLMDLGDDALDGWLLVKKGLQRGRNWKKRYVVLDGNGRIKYYANAEAARRNANIKGSLAVHAVKPADPLEFGANTLEVRGTLGGTYFFRGEDATVARMWLGIMTKRAIQSRVPGRIDSYRTAALTKDSTEDSTISNSGVNAITASSSSSAAKASDSAAQAAATATLKTHSLEAVVEDLAYAKETPLRQFYVVCKFKSELHDYSSVPVGQTIPKPCEKGVVTWNEKLAWHFNDHLCAECNECQAIGSSSGTFCGLPDIMVLYVYEIHLRYLTTKIGDISISLRELFGFTGMKEAQMHCAWPVTSIVDTTLGQLSIKLQYSVDNAGGPALQPLLVTSEESRESLGEYDIHPSIKNCVEFFELFYANGTGDRWQEYYKARGDTEVDIGEWSVSKEYGGQIRTISCRALTNASIGPSSTMTSQTQHVTFSDITTADPERFVLETKVFLHDIPYGDCFTVEQVMVVERKVPGNPQSPLVARVHLGIPFSKGCMFKSKIISATRESSLTSLKLNFECLSKVIEAGDGADSGPSTPFLASTEEERQCIGEYPLGDNIKDAMHFFDLFYANDTIHRWKGHHGLTGDAEHDFSEWADSSEHGGQVRTIKYRLQTNSPLGPASTMATLVQHVPFDSKRQRNVDPERLVLQTKLTCHDVPFGDCFTTECVHMIERDAESGKMIARVWVAVPFSKSTMFKGKIISATKDGVTKSTKVQYDELRRVADAEATANGGATGEPALAASPAKSDMVSANTPPSRSSADGGRPSLTSSSSPAPRRVLLTRLNSTLDGSVALEEIFENQRLSIFGKWGPNHLFPTDRSRFTNRNGDVALSFEQITLPPNWIWTTPWKIDKSYTDCDDEGWSYATDFPRFKMHLARGKSSSKRLGASVRRRRWTRMMCYVPPENTPNGSGSNSPSQIQGA